MAVPRAAGRVLAGGILTAGTAASVLWAAGSWGAGGSVPILTVAAMVGSGAAWWLERRHRRSLRRLRGRLLDLAEQVDPAGSAGRADDLAGVLDRVEDAWRLRAAAEDRLWVLEEIVQSMAEGVLLSDRDQRVELMNPAFRRLLAPDDSDPDPKVIELSRCPGLVGFLEELGDAEGVLRRRIEVASARTLELRGRRLAGNRRVVVARDLTEQLRLEATRRDLVANVSHELRTPLTAIRGYAENLREGVEEPEIAARFLDRILAQCRRLEALLEDLLELSRLEEAEKARPARSEIDLVALAEHALETVRGLAAERQVALDLRPQPLPTIRGSQEALERLLLNLLENAIKYNRAGGSVSVGVARAGGEVVLEVADGGIGVPRRDLRRIFERFYRVDRGRSREEGGTGLGLAIVKHAAQLHGGRVEVESELGRGSVFRVFLPLSG